MLLQPYRRVAILAAILFVGLLGSCKRTPPALENIGVGTPPQSNGNPSTPNVDSNVPDVPSENGTTYYQHLKPVLDANCNNCHGRGNIGPMSFTTYEETKKYASAILSSVKARRMPPFPADPGCNNYFADMSLTPKELNVFERWVADGAQEGSSESVGQSYQKEVTKLSRVDATIPIGPKYLAQGAQDVYRCFVVNAPIQAPMFVTGFRAVPDNKATVHHIITYYGSPQEAQNYRAMDSADPGQGYGCNETGPGGATANWIGGWAPGTQGSDYPPDTGILIEPGSVFIIQVHYNLANGAGADQSSIQLKLDRTVAKRGYILPFLNPLWLLGTMQIPAGQKNIVHANDAPLAGGMPFKLWSASLHMHQIASAGHISLQRANGQKECLVSVTNWNFGWQLSYGFKEPKIVQGNDIMHMDCVFDNSAEHQPVVGGRRIVPRNVGWGEGSFDEMCLGMFYVSEL